MLLGASPILLGEAPKSLVSNRRSPKKLGF